MIPPRIASDLLPFVWRASEKLEETIEEIKRRESRMTPAELEQQKLLKEKMRKSYLTAIQDILRPIFPSRCELLFSFIGGIGIVACLQVETTNEEVSPQIYYSSMALLFAPLAKRAIIAASHCMKGCPNEYEEAKKGKSGWLDWFCCGKASPVCCKN